MSPQLAKMLELKPMETSDVIIRGFNSQKNHSTKTVQFQISDANDSERFNCQIILVVEDFQLPKLKEHPTDIIRKYPHLNEITLTTLADLQVEVLNGCDLYSLIVARSVNEGPPNAPTAVDTKLGWSFAGPHPIETSMDSFFCQQCESRDEDLYDAVPIGGKQTHTEHAKLTPTTTKKMKEPKKYFRKLATKLMVDTKQVWCGEMTANFTITDSTPNAILHPCCNALTRHLI